MRPPVAIPLALMIATGYMFFVGETMNIVSMAGLTLAVGMVVDNSVVVLENIRRRRSEGASLRDAVRLVVYVTDMSRHRPIVNQVQEQLWGAGPYPPRTIVEVRGLNQGDIVEVEGTFYAPVKR